MAIPSLPWYPKLRRIVAPTDRMAKLGIVVIIVVSLLLLWRGDPVTRALWIIYLVSP